MSLAVYKSSAGSGKTFTLVKEYIKLVIDNPDNYKHILAITFTNKAANEMKSRILAYLSGMAYGNEPKYQKMTDLLESEIHEVLNLEATTIRERAKQALGNILHGYSNFAVSTIDKFVLLLVRSFTRELRLPINFDVELDEKTLIRKSIELLLGKVGSDQNLTRALVQFVESKIEDEKSWDIEKELRSFAKILLRESSVNAIEEIKNLETSDYIKISKQLSVLIKEHEEAMSKPGLEAMELFRQNNIAKGDTAYSTGGVYFFFKRFAEKDFTKPEPNTNVVKMLESGNWASGKCDSSKKIILENLIPELVVLLETASSQAEKLIPEYNLLKLIHQNIYPTAVFGEIEKVMEEFRENENIVHISEFNKRIASIVNSEPIPFIYERIGEKYHHYMVDEFQDTSLLQWQNLLPLYENSLSNNNFNMIVGDGKQAIYRWRNGEVEQFAALPKIFNKPEGAVADIRQQALINHYNEKSLNRNYRTRKEVVEFNNAFFKEASQNLPERLQKIYCASNPDHPEQELLFQEQDVDANDIGGSVQVEFLKLKQPENEEPLSKEETLEIELERIRSIIEDDLLPSSYQLNEITILTRTNNDAGNVARHLIENGINVVTNEALLLSASNNVHFIINLLRFLNDPVNSTVIADILIFLLEKTNRPPNEIHDLLLSAKEIHPGKPNTKHLENIIQDDFGFPFKTNRIKALNLYETAESMVRLFGLNDAGSDPFIRFFMDTILEFTTKNEESLDDFLEYWDEKGSQKSIVIPEETDAVKVMTIHKAKGLEFPVVIYPFANGSNKPGVNEFWIEPEISAIPQLKTALVNGTLLLNETKFAHVRQAEIEKSFLDLLNVLYVAMTRPSERMYVILHDKQGTSGEWKDGNNFLDVADLFHQFLQNNNLWQNEQDVYNFGYEGGRIKKQKEEAKKTASELYSVKLDKGSWRNKANLSFVSSKNWDFDSIEALKDRGILLHNIMARIKTEDDVDKAINQAIIEGLIQENEKENLRADISKIISTPEILPFFDQHKTIINEKEILLNNGDILRPDRIVVDNDETAVIDYKTGKKDIKHRDQVETYANALSSMGYKNLNKYLIYLNIENRTAEVVNW